jgi:hypothetical protein
MKLSEAIREGSKIRPQGFLDWFEVRDGQVCSCAMGAAYEAVRPAKAAEWIELLKEEGELFDDLNFAKLFPGLPTTNTFPCPACDKWGLLMLTQAAGHLNDDHEWTREAIADWVEGYGQ